LRGNWQDFIYDTTHRAVPPLYKDSLHVADVSPVPRLDLPALTAPGTPTAATAPPLEYQSSPGQVKSGVRNVRTPSQWVRLALVGQSAECMVTTSCGRHSQFIDRRITVGAPSLSPCAAVAAAAAAAEHASYSTVFLPSIDKHRHTQRQREEDAEYKERARERTRQSGSSSA